MFRKRDFEPIPGLQKCGLHEKTRESNRKSPS
jgi:hypothetical protein